MASDTINSVAVTPRELRAAVDQILPLRLPLLITGEPGVGKTDIVEAAAAACEHACLVFHPVVDDPTDYKGLPANVDGQAEFLPYSNLRALMEAKTPTVAFLDDVGQAPQVVQAALMQLLLKREINGKKISPKVTFIAATNRRQDRAGVTGILEPVKSRFCTILELKRDLGDWCKWAITANVPPELIALLRFQPDLFNMVPPPTQDIVNRVSPRTLYQMGKLYAAGITSLPVLAGAAGVAMATTFLGYVKVWQSLPSIDGILANPKAAPVPTEPSALYAVATALATRATGSNAGRVVAYLARLPEEYAALGVRDMQVRCPTAANHPEFIKWAVANQHLLD